jgi:HEAT repeat protein
MLRNSDSRIRGIAAAALGKIGDNQAVGSLISVLENKKDNLWVRDNAAWALLQLEEGTKALPLLRYLKWNHKNIFDSLKGFQFPSEFKNEASEG